MLCIEHEWYLGHCVVAPVAGYAMSLGTGDTDRKQGKRSQYSSTERRVPELIPVLGSQPAGDVSHKPGGRLPLLSARPVVTPRNFGAW